MPPAGSLAQTSVRLPREALLALNTYANANELSREQAVRTLVEQYVEFQNSQPHDERVTHVSTVLRYPSLPLGRGSADPRSHLRFRISKELKMAALEHAFILPGQSIRHGHHDYAARPLTDVLITAIARVQPFTLPGLEGLPALLRHVTAMGLWRLTVAATLTRAEKRAIWGEAGSDLTPVLTEEDVSWHHPWRYEVAHVLLSNIWNQEGEDDVAENMAMLHDQTEAFRRLLYDVRRDDMTTRWLLDNLPHPTGGVDGRGGSAVWRAQRRLALESIEKWIASVDMTPMFEVSPPGWRLGLPVGWQVKRFAFGESIPTDLTVLAERGLVAKTKVGSRTAFWPLTESGLPVAGFDAVLRGGAHLGPARLVEVALVDLESTIVFVPAVTAHELGFISAAERDALIAEADAANDASVSRVLKRAKTRFDHDEADAFAELTAAADNLTKFAKLAARSHFRFFVQRPTWEWDIGSIGNALAAHGSADRVEWLTRALAEKTTLELEKDMQLAWNKAFWLGLTTPEDTDL